MKTDYGSFGNAYTKIIITGGFGFIGSNLIEALNKQGITPYVVEDINNINEKWRNVNGLCFHLLKDINNAGLGLGPVSVVHLGANVDTTEKMNPALWANNVDATISLFDSLKITHRITKFIYASSAATYGAEEKDFSERMHGLKPQNAYAFTKLHLDNFFFGEKMPANKVYGLRFFNVYGPRENHKGNMASVVHKALTKQSPIYSRVGIYPVWNLFRSHRSDVADGDQARDFVYVEDVCRVIGHFLFTDAESGLYNVGSGEANTFNQLVQAVDPSLPIHYVPMPDILQSQYQYYTKANLTKLRATGYTEPFTSLQQGVEKTRAWLKTQ